MKKSGRRDEPRELEIYKNDLERSKRQSKSYQPSSVLLTEDDRFEVWRHGRKVIDVDATSEIGRLVVALMNEHTLMKVLSKQISNAQRPNFKRPATKKDIVLEEAAKHLTKGTKLDRLVKSVWRDACSRLAEIKKAEPEIAEHWGDDEVTERYVRRLLHRTKP